MKYNFKKNILFLILINLNFYSLKPIEDNPSDLLYSISGASSMLLGTLAIFSHANSEKINEAKFNSIESVSQLLNNIGSLTSLKKSRKKCPQDALWFAFDLFRTIKHFKKYKKLKHEKRSQESSNELTDDSPEKDLIDQIIAELEKPPQEVLKENNSENNNNPKSFLFKLKIGLCGALLIGEFSSSVCREITNNKKNDLKIKTFNYALKSLRYFLLSESGSLEAKFSIAMFLLNILNYYVEQTSITNKYLNEELQHRETLLNETQNQNKNLEQTLTTEQENLDHSVKNGIKKDRRLEELEIFKHTFDRKLRNAISEKKQLEQTFNQRLKNANTERSNAINEKNKLRATFEQKLREEKRIREEYEKLAKDLFGLTEPYSKNDVKKGHRKLLISWHPDKNQDKKDAANTLTLFINSVNELLEQKS